jgi:hypothetical protein
MLAWLLVVGAAVAAPLEGCAKLPSVPGGMQCGQALLVAFDTRLFYGDRNGLGDTYSQSTAAITPGIADALNQVVRRRGTVWAAGMVQLPEGEVRVWRVKAVHERGWASSAFRRDGAWSICLAPTGDRPPRDPKGAMLPSVPAADVREANRAAFDACKMYVARIAVGEAFRE